MYFIVWKREIIETDKVGTHSGPVNDQFCEWWSEIFSVSLEWIINWLFPNHVPFKEYFKKKKIYNKVNGHPKKSFTTPSSKKVINDTFYFLRKNFARC